MSQDIGAYVVLLILTDGEITDMDATISSIVDASYLPMSIVIVGIGDANFGKMDILDGDDATLRTRSKSAQRDIVQFVPYRNFRGDPARLSAEVYVKYFCSHK